MKTYLIITSLCHGGKAFEIGEYEALVRAGIIKD